mgnify:CR=1 FL=1
MIIPLPGYCLIAPIEDEVRTSSGLYTPEMDKDKPSRGEIVAFSSVAWATASSINVVSKLALRSLSNPMFSVERYIEEMDKINIGSIVIYKKFTNQEVVHDGKKYLLVNFSELLAIVEE